MLTAVAHHLQQMFLSTLEEDQTACVRLKSKSRFQEEMELTQMQRLKEAEVTQELLLGLNSKTRSLGIAFLEV